MREVGVQDHRSRPVGEVVAENYARAAAFKRLGIDFCCGGGRTVQEACDRAGISYETLLGELQAVEVRQGEGRWTDPRGWDPDLLVDHIVKLHHRYVRRTLPVLGQFTGKVSLVHGEAHPELREIEGLVQELSEEMTRHMEEEEGELFPALQEFSEDPGKTEPEDVATTLGALEDDHEHAGGIMGRIREITGEYTPPEGACATYRATFSLLEEFEEDLHRHVHLENNVLFPRVREMWARRGGVPLPA